MSLYRKLKSKVNKMMLNYGSKEIFQKGVCKDSISSSFSIYPIEYGFDMEEYSNYGSIFMIIQEVGVNEFELSISGGFGIYMESDEYIEIHNQIDGDYKYMLRFFKQFIRELHMDFTSIQSLYEFVECYN